MAAIFQLPKPTLFDANGDPLPGGKVYFYEAGTSTPLTVYSDSGLTTPVTQPVEADASGRFAVTYVPTGGYKVIVTDASDVLLYSADNLDTGIPAGGGALAVDTGGTGATTAAGARTNLGAAAQSDLDTVSTAVSDIQSQITDVGGTLGALAGRDDIGRAQLATGFGAVTLQSVVVASTAAQSTCSGTVPFDDTIPQNSEGTQVLTGSFTPLSGSSVITLDAVIYGVPASSGVDVSMALYKDTDANAIAAGWMSAENNARMIRHALSYRFASPGTSAMTLALRVGANTGNFYINGNSSGRLGGGVLLSFLRATEHLVF
ncbi:MAG TPA: hypothetical protein VHA53_06065 [Nitrolancea sp.]|nr:hypothetical protein [Nitrolancea sp.]